MIAWREARMLGSETAGEVAGNAAKGCPTIGWVTEGNVGFVNMGSRRMHVDHTSRR